MKGRRIAITFGGGSPSTPSAAPKPYEGTKTEGAPRGHTVWPWIPIAIGGAFVVTGVVLIATTPALPAGCDASNQTCDRIKNASGEFVETDEQYRDRQSDAGRHVNSPIYGGISMAIGGVLIAGGLIWHFLEPTGPEKSARIRFTPNGLAGTF